MTMRVSTVRRIMQKSGKTGMMLIIMMVVAACQSAPPAVSIEGVKAEMSPAIVGEAIVSLRIVNQGGADVLTGVRTDLAGATASFHLMEGLRMVTVDAMPVPARETVDLKLGGSHIMLEHMDRTVKEGSPLTITLIFKKSGEKQMQLTLQKSPSLRMNQGRR
jgi:periplasmic copper chaperone A